MNVVAGKPRREPDGIGSILLALPFHDALTPTSYALPADLSADQWLDVGRALRRVRGSIMWWVGDWWAYGEHAYGEHAYGERRAAVEADDWEGSRFQTCADAAMVSRAFETSRRREVLSFTAHRETAALPDEWQDKVLDDAARAGAGRARSRADDRRLH